MSADNCVRGNSLFLLLHLLFLNFRRLQAASKLSICNCKRLVVIHRFLASDDIREGIQQHFRLDNPVARRQNDCEQLQQQKDQSAAAAADFGG